jgi:hypothetical protein
VIVLANLDCEARWAGAPLGGRVLRRISAISALLAYLAPGDGEVEVWAPAPVDPARLSLPRRVTMRAGTPPRWDLAWADPAAKAANDRRLVLAMHERLGTRLPGQCAITSVEELDAMTARATGAGESLRGAWVAKAPWTAAGRDRIHGNGPPTGEQRVYAARLLRRCGALLVEPWLPRTLDLGVTARLEPQRGRVTASPPHTLLCDARGGFLGIDLAEPRLDAAHRAQLDRAVEEAGRALAEVGYEGPFTVDAFVHGPVDAGTSVHPGGLHVCEVNARHTFGHVARAIGARVLGFGTPPAGARVLVAPAPDDPSCAWTTTSS